MKLGFIGKFWFETHLKHLVTLMLSKLTFKKSKQTEKLKVITFFSVAHFGLLLPKTRLILAPIWPFLKNFWFRFRFLKDNSMLMINSTDFLSNLQKNRKMWTISYLLRWINNYRVLLLVYLGYPDLSKGDVSFFHAQKASRAIKSRLILKRRFQFWETKLKEEVRNDCN